MADPSTTLPTGGTSGFTPITDTPLGDTLDSLADAVGMNMFEEEIDDVIFMTNEFLSDSTFIGPDGAFWWILEACMCLGALFAVIMAAGMAYRMMVKGEGLDVLKILKVLGIGIVMLFWYPPSLGQHANMTGRWCILDALAYIPNCIGSYTHDLYEAEAVNVQDKFREMQPLLQKRDTLIQQMKARADILDERMGDSESATAITDPESVTANQQEAKRHEVNATYVGMMIFFDKIVMFFAMVIYRIGWWATIYCQQILLGMLTIFGPIQWAFSLLPKWEGAWAKWITRYMTVHFYGAMLYFVGFYVLLLFDIVISIQIENLNAITASEGTFQGYMSNAVATAGYLLVASVVALRCLNLVPDLAAWMIPEGDTAFSTRNFGEGVAQGAKQGASSVTRHISLI